MANQMDAIAILLLIQMAAMISKCQASCNQH